MNILKFFKRNDEKKKLLELVHNQNITLKELYLYNQKLGKIIENQFNREKNIIKLINELILLLKSIKEKYPYIFSECILDEQINKLIKFIETNNL